MWWVAFATWHRHAEAVWVLLPLDTSTAKTTIRLWHELYVARNIPHDFVDMLAPKRVTRGMYWGALRYDEIRAIAYCERRDHTTLRIMRIAHAPQQTDAPPALLRLLNDECIKPDWTTLRTQPRWFLEETFVLM